MCARDWSRRRVRSRPTAFSWLSCCSIRMLKWDELSAGEGDRQGLGEVGRGWGPRTAVDPKLHELLIRRHGVLCALFPCANMRLYYPWKSALKEKQSQARVLA